MMVHQAELAYAAGDGYQAVSLPYYGGVSMVVVLPADGQFAAFESALDARRLTAILSGLANQQVLLTLPKFDYHSESFSLKETLVTLGMPDAFIYGQADFSGMDGTHELYIDDGFHQASVTVDEAGTEAVAATSVQLATGGAAPEPSVRLTVDRPFIFLIRDDATGAMLFVGRIVNPRG
jgi:serpin B